MDAWAVVAVAAIGLLTTAYTQWRADKRAEVERGEARKDRELEREANRSALEAAKRSERIATYGRFIALMQRNLLILNTGATLGVVTPPNSEQSEDLAQARAALLLICTGEVFNAVKAVWTDYEYTLDDAQGSSFRFSYESANGKLENLINVARQNLELDHQGFKTNAG